MWIFFQELLADLHGMAAFKDFILRRGYRMPSVSKGSFQKDLLRGSQLRMGSGQHPYEIKILLFQADTTQAPARKGILSPRQELRGRIWHFALFIWPIGF